MFFSEVEAKTTKLGRFICENKANNYLLHKVFCY